VARRGRSASLRDWIEYAGFRTGWALLRALPEPIAYGLAAGAARRYFDLAGRRSGVALANLRIAYPELAEAARRRIGRESTVHLAWNLVDAVLATRWSEAELRRRIEVEGYEHFEAAAARGRGVLVLMPHLGSFELAGLAAPLFGVRATVIARPLSNRLVNRYLLAHRTRHGAELIQHRRVVPRVLEALREGRNVVIINDQYTRRSRGIFVPFFGVRASTSAGPATLALRSGAPVLPFYLVRLARDRHRAVCLPALELETTGSRKKDVEVATARMNHLLESIVRRHPEQWMWGHRRFRHSPDLPHSPYRA
jgi:KDO2-lipid IV(A) lauroyltransferase